MRASIAASYQPTSDAEEQRIGWTIRNTHHLFAQALSAAIANDIPSVSYWYYLRILWEQDGLSQLELSNRVGVSPTTTAPALGAMEQQGLVARARDSADRRKVKVFLTPRGRALQAALQPRAQEINRRALQGIGGRELQSFLATLTKIRANLMQLPLDEISVE